MIRIRLHLRGVRCSLQIDLYFAATFNSACSLRIPTTMRVNYVMAVTKLPEHRHLHVFEQADVLAFQIRGLGGMHGEYRVLPFAVGKRHPNRLALLIFR